MGVFRIRTALVVAGALALAGCETVSDLNPFSKETVLPGEREALFDNTDPVSAATGGKASVGSPSGVTWSQGRATPQTIRATSRRPSLAVAPGVPLSPLAAVVSSRARFALPHGLSRTEAGSSSTIRTES